MLTTMEWDLILPPNTTARKDGPTIVAKANRGHYPAKAARFKQGLVKRLEGSGVSNRNKILIGLLLCVFILGLYLALNDSTQAPQIKAAWDDLKDSWQNLIDNLKALLGSLKIN